MWKRIPRAKKSRDILRSLTCLTAACLMATAYIVYAGSPQNNLNTAKQKYNQGIDEYKKKDWVRAVNNFSVSYSLNPTSLVSYMMSCCYHQMEMAENALLFAKKALSDKPPLQDPFLTSARDIQNYASFVLEQRKNRPGFPYMKGKYDNFGPSFPKPAIAPIQDKPSPPLSRNVDVGLTGTWKSDHGAIYFIRQVDSVVWWYGESADGGKQWSHVFHGVMVGNRIKGTWADIPKGRLRNSGSLELQVEPSGRLKRTVGGFGDTFWTRVVPKVHRAQPARGRQ